MRTPIFFSLLLVILLFAGCSKDNNNSSRTILNVYLTDAPLQAEEVNVEIKEVLVSFEKNPNGWLRLDTNEGIYNLLALQNGVTALIASSVISNQVINEIRLVLGDANSIKIAGKKYAMTIPSGSESGMKVKVKRKLKATLATLTIDFDASLSITQTGNNKYILKPVLSLK